GGRSAGDGADDPEVVGGGGGVGDESAGRAGGGDREVDRNGDHRLGLVELDGDDVARGTRVGRGVRDRLGGRWHGRSIWAEGLIGGAVGRRDAGEGVGAGEADDDVGRIPAGGVRGGRGRRGDRRGRLVDADHVGGVAGVAGQIAAARHQSERALARGGR